MSGALIIQPFIRKLGLIGRRGLSIISNADQRPTKRNVCAIAIALELKRKDCKHLIKSAGCIINRDPFDLFIRYCIEQELYDPLKEDSLLVEKGLKPLFSA